MTHVPAVPPRVAVLARALRRNRFLLGLARLGLVSRAFFFALLAVLAGRLAVGARRGAGADQSNANGALHEVASTRFGVVLLAVAAASFAAYAVVRLAGALTDQRESRLRRLSTAGQALIYGAFAVVTARFDAGAHTSGSEQSQRESVRSLLELPAGRALLAGAGLGVLAAASWQIRVAVLGDYGHTLQLERMSPALRRTTQLLARTAIPVRALALLPVGVFLIVAAVRSDPDDARGPDAILLDLTGSVAGRIAVAVVAFGCAVFALYSLVEARYRLVAAGA